MRTVVVVLMSVLVGCLDAQAPTIRLISDPETAREPQGEVAIHEESICELLPDDGPCADACDPDALAEHVPVGLCVEFACELTDGRIVGVGACHH